MYGTGYLHGQPTDYAAGEGYYPGACVILRDIKEEINMKVLLTGFDPFGGESVNPAFEAIKLLPSTIAGAEIVYVEIPTEFKKSAPAVTWTMQVTSHLMSHFRQTVQPDTLQQFR